MRVRGPLVMVSVALGATALLSMNDSILAQQGVPQAPRPRGPVPAGEMGDYVVVPNWPKPLPDTMRRAASRCDKRCRNFISARMGCRCCVRMSPLGPLRPMALLTS